MGRPRYFHCMTDDEIRDVFSEFRRIGVDLGQPHGLALGTGFGEGEFLAWLRTLPDGLGHDAFVEDLNAHIAQASPNVVLPDGTPAPRPRRYSPTVDQVHAAIDILLREWDPLGARLGELTRDDVAIPAFNAVNAILHGGPTRHTEAVIAAQLRMTEREAFDVRAAPLIQTRYLVRRIMQVVADNPGPPHEFDPFESIPEEAGDATAAKSGMRSAHSSRSTVRLGPRGDEPPALGPDAACDDCGTIGTVAWVTRDTEPRLSRYCADCWRRVRHRYWWPADMPDKETPEGMIAIFDHVYDRIREKPRGSGSALWEDQLGFFTAATKPDEDIAPDERDRRLRQFASQLADLAPRMYGPMPPEIAAFVQRYAGPDA